MQQTVTFNQLFEQINMSTYLLDVNIVRLLDDKIKMEIKQ